jgi:tetratricopeptide (TPR) repeat protein
MNKSAHAGLIVLLSATLLVPSIFGQTRRGIELFNSGQFQQAEKVLSAAMKANPSDLSAVYYLGLSNLLQKKHNEALALFMKVRRTRDKMDPKSRPAAPSEYQIQLAFARTNLEMKHFDEGWKNLDAAGKENPKSPDVFVYRGVYYLDQEKHNEALKELTIAISMDGKNAYAYYYQGMAYFHSGVADKAVNSFKKFIELAPAAPEADEAKRLINILC